MIRNIWDLSKVVVVFGSIALLEANAGAEQLRSEGVGPPQVRRQPPPVTPTFFRTLAVPISADRFSDEWERARRDASAMPQIRRLITPVASLPRRQQVAYIQATVHRMIRWRSDATVWGRHDYWASAEETLRRGFGDMEDRAIVKMQALRALNVPTSDLYLTLGRDTVGGPQTVLIVRDGQTYYVLDDTGGPPYTPDRRPEFNPVLTFGYGASWVHTTKGAPQLQINKDPSEGFVAGRP